MVELTNVCFIVVTIIALVTQVIVPIVKGPLSQLQPELAAWLQEQALEKHAGLFVDAGVWRLVDVVEMGPLRGLPLVEQERTTAAVFDLKQRLILSHFLKKHGTETGLPRDKKELDMLSEEIWTEIAKMYHLPSARGWSLSLGEYTTCTILYCYTKCSKMSYSIVPYEIPGSLFA
ncbi:uncharacterized protein LOC121863711 isoform X2 [Homarus americanus]|uniref:uncharacterized protein LOC121863711 isoform X2 n=1 Tax=Homarus americanus TaxID=6706 RepID=UPI001C449AE0|nr:uncharacterized protein LOC121863711 isoform X2 [Homarus americanus]